MNELLALRLRGWTHSGAPESLAQELLGASARRAELEWIPHVWSIQERLRLDDPVGPIRALVVFASASSAVVDIAPGTQGLGLPPEQAGNAVIRSQVVSTAALLLDARCWYRIQQATDLCCSVWRHLV